MQPMVFVGCCANSVHMTTGIEASANQRAAKLNLNAMRSMWIPTLSGKHQADHAQSQAQL